MISFSALHIMEEASYLDSDSRKENLKRASKSQLVKKRWTPPEDIILKMLVKKHGLNWTRISHSLSGRAAKQCRERWLNHLDPKIRKGKLSDSEWAKIRLAHRSCGNRWTKIARLLPGRSPNQIKNYWHARTRKEEKRRKRGLALTQDDFPSRGKLDKDPAWGPHKTKTNDSTVSEDDKTMDVVIESPCGSPLIFSCNTSISSHESFTNLDCLVYVASSLYEQDFLGEER